MSNYQCAIWVYTTVTRKLAQILSRPTLESTWTDQFKLVVLVYNCLHGEAPSYLTDDLQLQSADLEIRSRLQSASTSSLPVSRGTRFSDRRCSYLERFAVSTHVRRPRHLCQFSVAAWRPTPSAVHFISLTSVICSDCEMTRHCHYWTL